MTFSRIVAHFFLFALLEKLQKDLQNALEKLQKMHIFALEKLQ